MNALRCDLCGGLYCQNGQIRIGSLAGIYYTLFRSDNGEVVDICDTCRCRLQDVLDNIRGERLKAERQDYEL